LFVVDARSGLTPADRHFAQWLRRSGKPVVLVANKAESRAADAGLLEAFELGLGDPVAISAEHGIGMPELREAMVEAAGGSLPAGEQERAKAGESAMPGENVEDPDSEPAYDATKPLRIA